MAEAAVWPYGLGIAVFVIIAVVTVALRKKRKGLWFYFQITAQIVGFLHITKFLFNLFPKDQ